MSKKSKRHRVPGLIRQDSLGQTTQTIVPEKSIGAKVVPGSKSVWKAEYILQQYYVVTIDEQLIEEKWLSHFTVEGRERAQEEVARFKRMLRGIIADRKALKIIIDYLVLAEQDSMGDGATSYVTEHYEEDKGFATILAEQAHCFPSEDREWLLSLVNDEEQDFDLDLQIEGLREAFHLKPSGFNVGQHACKLETI